MMKEKSLLIRMFALVSAMMCALGAEPIDNLAITESAGMRGDVNGDSVVDISDVTLLINYLLKGHW